MRSSPSNCINSLHWFLLSSANHQETGPAKLPAYAPKEGSMQRSQIRCYRSKCSDRAQAHEKQLKGLEAENWKLREARTEEI